MPFVLRTWMYVSGVMSTASPTSLEHTPALGRGGAGRSTRRAVYIDLIRYALIDSFTGCAAAAARLARLPSPGPLVAGVGGFIYFWKAEEQYGRG